MAIPFFSDISGQGATFSGDVDLTAGQLELRGDVALDHDGSSLYVKAPSSIFLYPGNTNKGNINTAGLLTVTSLSTGAATFAGNVDVTRSSTGEILSRIWNSNTGGNGTAVMRIANSGNQANGARLEFSDQNYYNATVSVDRTNGMRFMVHDDSTNMSDLLTHPVLTLATNKNATFAGNVLLQGDSGNAQKFLAIYNEGTNTHDDVVLGFKTHGSRQYSIGIDRSTTNFTLSNLYASVSSGVLLSVDNSGNATFAGDMQANNIGLGAAASSFGTGVPTLYLKGTNSTNGRAGAIHFVENDGDNVSALYSTTGADGYGTVLCAYQGDLKFATGGLTGTKLTIASGGAATFAGAGTFETTLNVSATDGGGSPAMTAVMNMHGYDQRGVGIKMKDNKTTSGGSTDAEWFVGTGYNSTGFNIGYASDGSQSSYPAQAKLAITTAGDAIFTGSVNVKTDKVQIDQDGTYGSGYGTVGFGGKANGYNRVFGNTGTADGLFLASATGRGVFIRVNGASTDTHSFGSNGYVGMGIASNNNQRLTLAQADANGSHLKMNNSRSGGGYWVVGVGDTNSNSSIVDPGGLFFYNGSTKLKLDSSGNATFAGDVTIGDQSSSASTQAFGNFDQLKFDNSHSSTNVGPNKIVMHDNGSAWIGGFGIHSDTVSYYTGGEHVFYKTTSQTASTQLLSLGSTGATFAGAVTIDGVNDTYNFKAMATDTDSWFGVYEDANNSANIAIIRSDSNESFKVLGHQGNMTVGYSTSSHTINGTTTFTGTITTDRLSLFTSNTDRATIQAGSSGTTGHLYLNSYTGTTLKQLTWSAANSGFYPQGASGSFDLGLNGNRWNRVYATAFYGDGSNLTGVTVSNADTVDNLHAASFLRSDADDTATGNLTFSGTTKHDGGLYFTGDTHMGFVPYPKGAQYRSDSSTDTGYILIKLPTDISNSPDDMMSFYVDIYDYTTNEMISVFVGGYNYRHTPTSSNWYNCTAIINTKRQDKDFNVRFGHDGTNYYVAIGETTSVWAHPSIVVRDFQCSYRGNAEHYVDGWAISTETTTLSGVDETQSGNLPSANGTFAGDVTVTGGQVFLTASNYAIENVSGNYGIRNSSGNYGGNDGANAYTTPQDFFHIPGDVRIGPKFATSDRDYIRFMPRGSTSTIEMPNENAYIHNNAGNIVLRTGSSTDAVTVTGANTIFAGNVSGVTASFGSGTSRFTDTSAYPLQLNRGLAVDTVGAAGVILGLGSYSTGTTYVDAVRMVGVLAANGTDGDMQLQVLNSGSYTNALTLNNNNDANFAGNATFEGDVEIHNEGNDTTGKLTISGNNNTGTPGQKTSGTIEHRGAHLKTVITHNGSDVITIGTGTHTTFGGNIIAGGAVYPASNASASLGLSDKQWAGLDLSSSSAITWGNGDAEIIEGETNNYSLTFKTYDGTSNSAALRLDGNNTATFTGDVVVNKQIVGVRKNHMTTEDWGVGGFNMTGYFGGSFSGSEASNAYREGPYETRELVQETVPDSGNDFDGGWNKSLENLDINKAYMSIVYVKRVTSQTSGSFYHGTGAGANQILNLNGASNTNPYFVSINIGTLPQDVWCVSVGYIQANNDSNTTEWAQRGVYRLDTGERIYQGTTYKMGSAGTTLSTGHRVFLYYSTDNTSKLQFARPGHYEMNGHHPTINELVNPGGFARQGDTENRTFAGAITNVGSITTKASGTSNSIVAQWQATNANNCATFRTTDSGHIFRIHAQNSGTIYVQNDDGSNYLKIPDSGSNEIEGNTTFAGTITAAGGSGNNDDGANILTLNASEHARLLVDTSSTSGHRATLALESNGNELTLGTTGSASYLDPVGELTISGQVIFPSAATTRPVLPNGFISRNDLTDTSGRHDIWGISEKYYPSNSTAGDAWGIQWSGTPNDIVFVGGGTDRFTVSLDEGNVTSAGKINTTGASMGTIQSDGDYIAKLYTASADGFLELFTGEGTPVSRVKLSSYGDSYINAASTARLGIGTASPSERLEVTGNFKLNGTLVQEGTGSNVTFKYRTTNSSAYTGGNATCKFGRFYWTPAHWVTGAPVIKVTLHCKYYQGERREYIIKAGYQNTDPIINELQPSSTQQKITLVVGATTSAGYNYANQPVYYVDLQWVQTAYIWGWAQIESQQGFLTSNPTSGWGGVVMDSGITQTNGGLVTDNTSFFAGKLGVGTQLPTSQLHVNNTVDGDKIRWGKSNVLVGSVGTYNGVPYIGYQNGGGGGIMFNGTSIEPTTLGSTRSNNTNDIGSANYKWRYGYFGTAVNTHNLIATNSSVLSGPGSGTSTVLQVNHGAGSHTGIGIKISSANSGHAIDLSGSVGSGYARLTSAYNNNPDFYTSGTITAGEDVIAYSDLKLKENIKTLDGSKVYNMRGVSFTRKDTEKHGSGVIAQEMQKIAPELVNEIDGTLGVSYGNLTGYLIEAIKDLKAEIQELKKQIK